MPLTVPSFLVLAALSTVPTQDFAPRGELLAELVFTQALFPADFDGDGEQEILARAPRFPSTKLRLWGRATDGTWTESIVVPSGDMSDPVVGDIDGDGFDDLAMGVESTLSFFSAEPRVYFGGPTGLNPTPVVLGPTLLGEAPTVATPDFDGDGDLDVVIYTGFERGVYRNDGARVFVEVAVDLLSTPGLGVTTIDVDGDLLDDLIAAQPGWPPADIVWLRSRGDGTFDAPAFFADAPQHIFSELTRGDMDGDGDLDIICNESFGPSSFAIERESFWLEVELGQRPLFRNEHSVGVLPGEVLRVDNVQDVDLDGVADVIGRPALGPTFLQRGLGNGEFGPPLVIDGTNRESGIAVDVDQDGDMDIVTARSLWYENVSVVSQAVCPGELNSTGVAAELTARGSELVALGRTFLVGTDLPPGTFGMFLTTATTGPPTPLVNSLGSLCLGATIGRFNRPGEVQAAGSDGRLTLRLDLGDVPDPLATSVSITAPATRAFQLWYRDAAGSGAPSNLTGAVLVSFR